MLEHGTTGQAVNYGPAIQLHRKRLTMSVSEAAIEDRGSVVLDRVNTFRRNDTSVDHRLQWANEDKVRLEREIAYLNERNRLARDEIGKRDSDIKRLARDVDRLQEVIASQSAELAERNTRIEELERSFLESI